MSLKSFINKFRSNSSNSSCSQSSGGTTNSSSSTILWPINRSQQHNLHSQGIKDASTISAIEEEIQTKWKQQLPQKKQSSPFKMSSRSGNGVSLSQYNSFNSFSQPNQKDQFSTTFDKNHNFTQCCQQNKENELMSSEYRIGVQSNLINKSGGKDNINTDFNECNNTQGTNITQFQQFIPVDQYQILNSQTPSTQFSNNFFNDQNSQKNSQQQLLQFGQQPQYSQQTTLSSQFPQQFQQPSLHPTNLQHQILQPQQQQQQQSQQQQQQSQPQYQQQQQQQQHLYQQQAYQYPIPQAQQLQLQKMSKIRSDSYLENYQNMSNQINNKKQQRNDSLNQRSLSTDKLPLKESMEIEFPEIFPVEIRGQQQSYNNTQFHNNMIQDTQQQLQLLQLQQQCQQQEQVDEECSEEKELMKDINNVKKFFNDHILKYIKTLSNEKGLKQFNNRLDKLSEMVQTSAIQLNTFIDYKTNGTAQKNHFRNQKISPQEYATSIQQIHEAVAFTKKSILKSNSDFNSAMEKNIEQSANYIMKTISNAKKSLKKSIVSCTNISQTKKRKIARRK